MGKTLQILSKLALAAAGIVYLLCIIAFFQGTSKIKRNPGLSIADKHRQTRGGTEKSNQEKVSPLVKQAEAFALYLNPPEPPKTIEAPLPISSSSQNRLAVILPKTTPKFSLLGTSYYCSKPEESMALISEPGRGTRWVKQGDHLGHFIVEKVTQGGIVYRNGDWLGKMTLKKKTSAQIHQTHQMTLGSNQTNMHLSRSVNSVKQKVQIEGLLQKHGRPQSEIQQIAYDEEKLAGNI